MAETSTADSLTEKRYVIAVLRLVVDRRGRLEHGELVDGEGRLQARFEGWQALLRALRSWLAAGAPGD